MFFDAITGKIAEVTPNDQTRYQCVLHLTTPLDSLDLIEPGSLIAAENIHFTTKEKRWTILQVVSSFPTNHGESKVKKTRTSVTLRCTATPLGLELVDQGKKGPLLIRPADTFPEFDGDVSVLDDDTTASVLHQIAPESRAKENGTRIDVGTYTKHSGVKVGLDAASLMRGNIGIISARPRARTTITNNLVAALLGNPSYPVHVVYCDVNNQGLLSLINLLQAQERGGVLCLNDKFVPASVFTALKTPADRQAHKRAVYDFLDMMILPSVLEARRHDFTYPISGLLRANKVSIFRANELTVDQFINDIRIDILDGVEPEVEEYISNLMDGIAQTYSGERFNDKNMHDILDMIDEFSQDSRSHASRRTIYDLRAEVQSVSETYSKDIPAAARRTVSDIVAQLNDETKPSLLVVQGQKPTEILRFVGTLAQTLVEERLKRLKIRVPVLFIFNNIDEYVQRNSGMREQGGDRFSDLLALLLQNGRRHGLGFCLTAESAGAFDRPLARRIGSHFVGPITFQDEPAAIAELLNVSEELLRPAVNYEDGRFLFMSTDSPYHRRVPLPVTTMRNTDTLHAFLDEVIEDQERKRREFQAQEEERARRQAQDRDERMKREAEMAAQRAAEERESARRAAEAAEMARHAPIDPVTEFVPAASGEIASEAAEQPEGPAGKKKPREPRKQKSTRKVVAEAPAIDDAQASAPDESESPAPESAPQETLTFELKYSGYDTEPEEAPAASASVDFIDDGFGPDDETGEAQPAKEGTSEAGREGGREGGRKRGSRGGRGRRRSSKKKPQ